MLRSRKCVSLFVRAVHYESLHRLLRLKSSTEAEERKAFNSTSSKKKKKMLRHVVNSSIWRISLYQPEIYY